MRVFDLHNFFFAYLHAYKHENESISDVLLDQKAKRN